MNSFAVSSSDKVCNDRSALPGQGEKESEGRFYFTFVSLPTPYLDPLPLRRGEDGKMPAGFLRSVSE
jgi:hypothetical protein